MKRSQRQGIDNNVFFPYRGISFLFPTRFESINNLYANGYKYCICAYLKCVTQKQNMKRQMLQDECVEFACSHLNATDRSLNKTLIGPREEFRFVTA